MKVERDKGLLINQIDRERMGCQSSSSEMFFQISVMLGYFVFFGTLSKPLYKAFQDSTSDSKYRNFCLLYSYAIWYSFQLVLLPLTGFRNFRPTTIELFVRNIMAKYTAVELFYKVFFLAAVCCVTTLYDNSVLVSMAFAAFFTFLASVLQLGCGGASGCGCGCGSGSPKTKTCLAFSRVVVVASLMGAFLPAVRECWMVTVAAIVPAVPSMIALLLNCPPCPPRSGWMSLPNPSIVERREQIKLPKYYLQSSHDGA